CHNDITQLVSHPRPADVSKELQDFFGPEKCTACHEEALDDIDSGVHGNLVVENHEDMDNCLQCHDPHYQMGFSGAAREFDPSRPVRDQCGACHEPQESLPPLDAVDEACLSCHRSIAPEHIGSSKHISRFCFHCHALKDETKKTAITPLIDVADYDATAHARVSCLTCHPDAAQFSHSKQTLGDCRQCHLPHDEKVAHDAHFRVSCGACHLESARPIKDTDSGNILWQVERESNDGCRVHHLIRTGEESSCRRCHFKGNPVGASAMVLPAKSLLCMPCHAATFSVGDTTTVVSLIVFLLSILNLAAIWLSGSMMGEAGLRPGKKLGKIIRVIFSSVFSTRIFVIISALILDAFLQRRLFRQSRTRWIIHCLIFFPFVFRLLWGLFALVSSLWVPDWVGIRVLLDKNHPVNGFLFDLSGGILVLGIALVMARRVFKGESDKLQEMPKPDWPAFCLLGGIIMVGFILEGMRIAMTGSPAGAEYAFLGYGISRLFINNELTGIYGYIWYVHAILTGVFVAYLPFSRMFHMIMAPVSLTLNAASSVYENLGKALEESKRT
ncbi:MAG: respiratory nitrate reductase subunit gamma, partial [Deltaproteobacteria bacterium]|nr:respiratory nitrate reductase subunit gamma [Deltaproteobacteria bacterium]